MSDIYGYDTDSTITEADVARAKVEGAGYVAGYLGEHRNLTAAAAKIISDAGLKILSFSENHGTRRMLQGAAAGSGDAAADAALARAIGMPSGSCIFAADDEDTTAEEQPAVLRYMGAYARALRALGYRPAYYGNEAMCHVVRASGFADATCRAGGSGMRGYGQFGDYDISQDVGDKHHFNLRVSIDSETARDALGLWSLSEPAPQPSPQPTPRPTEGPTLDHTLEYGVANDDSVRLMQQRLTDLAGAFSTPSWDPKGVDGDFGADTLAAVKAFQIGRYLISDGVVMPADPAVPHSGETWKALWK
ncbi:MAG: DUF1906 domain-containing protein [Elusimicrobia bacterium]|nr:DUF1906 domain-containing protein [Elusimicrobiota bacterium]